MNRMYYFIIVFVGFVTQAIPACGERAWEGHIRLIDSNIVMVFEGYDYGTWDDVGRLEFHYAATSSAATSLTDAVTRSM